MGNASTRLHSSLFNRTLRGGKSSSRQPRLPSAESSLSAAEADAIERNWARSEQNSAENSGTRLFRKIFHKAPDTRLVFDLPSSSAEQDIHDYPRDFFKHIRVFMNMLELAVSKCRDLNSMRPLCMELGHRHYRMAKMKGFHLHHWATFQEAIIECAIEWDTVCEEDEEEKQLVHAAWTKLVNYIIFYMKVGYDEAKAKDKQRGDEEDAGGGGTKSTDDNT